MKIVTVLFVFLVSINSFSQKKHPDGPYKEYHKNSQLRKVGAYKNDKKVGLWKHYFDDGKLHKRYLHDSNGKFTGVEEIFSEEGTLLSDTKQNEDGALITKKYLESGELFAEYRLLTTEKNNVFIKEGVYKEYYKNGALKVECTYVNNKRSDVYRLFYDTGELKSEVVYVKGLKQGVFNQFFKNGKLKLESFYIDDKLSGLWSQYYESGEKKWEVEYLNDSREGFYKQYHENGKLKVEGVNIQYYKNGKEKQFDQNGNLVWQGSYIDGQFDGVWEEINLDGDVINKLKYNKGEFKKGNVIENLHNIEIPNAILDRVPIYPGCENMLGNKDKRVCMSKKISSFISKKFDKSLFRVLRLSGKHKINLYFKVTKSGVVNDFEAKSKYRLLSIEAVRLGAMLPDMKPGIKDGEAVTVPYSVPIIFQAHW
ncbi:hypothetical protein [Thalassobellus sediminis]|uniref:hypothetical protein n=1 Tax=Thalassobellus sediminis TaxID=3367753 RepID=UPI00379CED6E